ncbi:esterase domain protein [Chlamydia psittaci 06-1683]|nr:esterase domain protein [Chlamydia psittaci 06-1683]
MREFLKYGSKSTAIEQVPEEIELQVKEDKQKSSRLNTSKNKDIYIIHCFGSHPYNLYGFPKSWKPSSQQKSETNPETLGK